MLTEGKGIPIGIAVAGANRHDMKLVAATLESMAIDRPEPTEDRPQNICLNKGVQLPSDRRVGGPVGIYGPHSEPGGRETG